MIRAPLFRLVPRPFARCASVATGHCDGDDEFAHLTPLRARLNHGSFGAAPRSVLRAQTALRDEWLAHPDHFYFSGRLGHELENATAAAARAAGAAADRTVLVENASVAAAIVFNRWAWLLQQGRHAKPGDAVAMLEWRYGACENILRATVGRAGARLVPVPMPFPLEREYDVLRSLDAVLTRERPKFVLLDHVTSQPAARLPVKAMVELCRRHGVLEVAVDGAHGVGCLDLTSAASVDGPTCVGADWWFSNLHKW